MVYTSLQEIAGLFCAGTGILPGLKPIPSSVALNLPHKM